MKDAHHHVAAGCGQLNPGRETADASSVTDLVTKPGRKPRESGYVMVVTILVFPLLLICLAFVVDVSMFFFKSIQVQRTADSASLAGVTRMPRVIEAQKLAIDIAKRNGYQDGVGGVTITVAPPPDTNKRLIVTIRDDSTVLFFGNSLLQNWKIEKSSTAEYVSNIPLGSKENVIGNGVLTDSGPAQGFWLAISGPCAPKEAGDQIASRYDGNAIKRQRFDTDTQPLQNGAMLCDYNKSQSDTTAPYPAEGIDQNFRVAGDNTATYHGRLRRYIAKARDDRNTATPDLFPALSLNRDWDDEGYNYIVDVPCKNTAGGDPPPPPCDGASQTFNDDTSTSGKDLVIQAYDPVFNPRSVQDFLNGTLDPSRPDLYGVPDDIQPQATPCAPATPAGCNPNVGVGNPGPDDVRVRTTFTVYAPDLTPLDYSDDVALPGATQEYGSCVRYFDTPETFAPAVDTLDANPSVSGATNLCTTASKQWVTLARIPASGQRGRYRINVRTQTAPNSFGSNSFALRSFFEASASPGYLQCGAVPALACASVSGDSTMGVFATAPSIKEFYLAKLSPPSLYRGKTVMVRLWDAGEGGSSLQVLRPKATSETCNYGTAPDPVWVNPDPAASSAYCSQKVEWRIGQTGVNVYNDPVQALQDNTRGLSDVCDGKGQADVFSVPIQGNRDFPEGCTVPVPQPLYDSRNGPYDAERGKFNDRMVNVKINVPGDYGCVNPAPAECVDLAPSALPQQGWWKIKYIPIARTPDLADPSPYKAMTDRSTWTVELLGEPVHLVLNK